MVYGLAIGVVEDAKTGHQLMDGRVSKPHPSKVRVRQHDLNHERSYCRVERQLEGSGSGRHHLRWRLDSLGPVMLGASVIVTNTTTDGNDSLLA